MARCQSCVKTGIGQRPGHPGLGALELLSPEPGLSWAGTALGVCLLLTPPPVPFLSTPAQAKVAPELARVENVASWGLNLLIRRVGSGC